jgi:hypothetical protein
VPGTDRSGRAKRREAIVEDRTPNDRGSLLMLISICASALLIALTTVIHYEALRAMYVALPSLSIPNRTKLLVVIFGAFAAHFLEIGIYGAALYLLVRELSVLLRRDLHLPGFWRCHAGRSAATAGRRRSAERSGAGGVVGIVRIHRHGTILACRRGPTALKSGGRRNAGLP